MSDQEDFGEGVVHMALEEDEATCGAQPTPSHGMVPDAASPAVGAMTAMAQAMMGPTRACNQCGKEIAAAGFEEHTKVWCSALPATEW